MPPAVRPAAAVWIWEAWSAAGPRPFLLPQVWLSPGRAVRVARGAVALLARWTAAWLASWFFRARGPHSWLEPPAPLSCARPHAPSFLLPPPAASFPCAPAPPLQPLFGLPLWP